MRLIDADAYRDDFMQTVYDLFSDEPDNIKANLIIDAFDRIPTAYDVNAVVEQMEKIEEHCLDMHDWQGQSAIEKAIEIVKGGGIDATD